MKPKSEVKIDQSHDDFNNEKNCEKVVY